MSVLNNVSAVCFDAFGTLIKSKADRQSPYLWLLKNSVDQSSVLRDQFLKTNEPLEYFVRKLGFETHLGYLQGELDREVGGIELYEESLTVIERLRSMNKRIVLCSNLMFGYGDRVKALLPEAVEARIFSFEVGAIKPQPEIYQAVCDQLSLPPGRILFLGDSPRCDEKGPREFGMKSLLLNRKVGQTLQTLLQIR